MTSHLLSALLLTLAVSFGTAQTEPERFFTLEVEGGAHAGRYAAQDSGACLYDHSWDITYHLEHPSGTSPDSLGLLLLTVPDENDLGAFTLVAGFGDYNTHDYTEYTLDPASGAGTGSVQVEKNGKHAVLTVNGTTADGVTFAAKLECLDIFDNSGETPPTSELDLSFPPDADAPTGSLELRVGGQSYRVQTGDEASCDRHAVEGIDLWYEYDPGGSYTGVMLVVLDLAEAESGTDTFGFGIDFHPYYANGDSGGTVTATRNGDALTLQAELTTADGTPVSATIVCPKD